MKIPNFALEVIDSRRTEIEFVFQKKKVTHNFKLQISARSLGYPILSF